MTARTIRIQFDSAGDAYALASELRRRFDATEELEVVPAGTDTAVVVPERIWRLHGVAGIVRRYGGRPVDQ